MIRRNKPLPRSASPIARGKRPNAVNKKRKVKAFAAAYHSKGYVRYVHSLPCAACGQSGEIDAAHTETGGMGIKAGWETLIALCRRCHTKVHQSGWMAVGMTETGRQRAAALTREGWEERGDHEED